MNTPPAEAAVASGAIGVEPKLVADYHAAGFRSGSIGSSVKNASQAAKPSARSHFVPLAETKRKGAHSPVN
jgi:hypothetical protein